MNHYNNSKVLFYGTTQYTVELTDDRNGTLITTVNVSLITDAALALVNIVRCTKANRDTIKTALGLVDETAFVNQLIAWIADTTANGGCRLPISVLNCNSLEFADLGGVNMLVYCFPANGARITVEALY